MIAMVNVGRWFTLILCLFMALNTSAAVYLLIHIRVAWIGASFDWTGIVTYALASLLFLVAAWGLFKWRPWARYLSLALYGLFLSLEVKEVVFSGPDGIMVVAVTLFTAIVAWLFLPGVCAQFKQGRKTA